MQKYDGKEFLKKLYKELTDKKYEGNDENLKDIVLELCHKKYVIKPENISEAYMKSQREFAKQMMLIMEPELSLNGKFIEEDEVQIDYKSRRTLELLTLDKQIKEQVIVDQKISLDDCIEYLASKRTENYPTWFKYYFFKGIINIGYINEKTGKFTMRYQTPEEPFVDINPNAMEKMYEEKLKMLNKEQIKTEDLKGLLTNVTFAKEYAKHYKEDYVKRNEYLKSLNLDPKRFEIDKEEMESMKKVRDALKTGNTENLTEEEKEYFERELEDIKETRNQTLGEIFFQTEDFDDKYNKK